MHGGDYTREAEALFTRFAERHGLRYEVERDAPVEVMWNFPEQNGLTLPVVLGLQNGDELNFGVADFWSYFFPFEKPLSSSSVRWTHGWSEKLGLQSPGLGDVFCRFEKEVAGVPSTVPIASYQFGDRRSERSRMDH